MKKRIIGITIIVIAIVICGITYFKHQENVKQENITKQVNELENIKTNFLNTEERDEKFDILKSTVQKQEKYDKSKEKDSKVLAKYKEIILDQDFKMYVEDFKQPNSGIIFPNPNAPTGLLVSLDFIEEVLKSNPDSIVVVDEAYIDFGGQTCVPLIDKYDNLVVIQTFSKSRSFAGARLGVALGNKEAISHLYDVKNSFNSYPVDYITQQIGLASVLDSQDMKEKCQKVIKTREYTKTKLKELGFVVPDSYANFVFVKHPEIDGEKLFLALRQEGIIVRHWNKPLIDQYLRITIGTDKQMERLFEFLEKYITQQQREGE